MVKSTRCSIALVVTLISISSLAFTQTRQSDCPEAEGSDSVCEESRIELSRITVTATRRESPIEKVPASITVLSGAKLREMGASTFEDYARSVPGLSFTDFGVGGEKFTIRGVSSSIMPETRAATAVYLDETPMTHAGGFGLLYSPDPVLIDVARVEVLRGPQGTLFGSGSMGGAIRIITNEPDLYAFESFAEAIVSGIRHGGPGYDVRAMFNAPFADGQAAIRAVAWYRDLDGWIDNTVLNQKDVNNNETTGFRLAGTWFNQDRLSINGKIVYQDRQSDGANMDQGNPPYTQQFLVEMPNEDEWTLANLNVEYRFDWGSLISTTSWLDRVVDSKGDISHFVNLFLYPLIDPDLHTTVTAVNHDDVTEFVQEFRLFSTGENRLDWLLGFFYQDQDIRFHQDFPAPGFDEQTGGLGELFGAADSLFKNRSSRTLDQIAVFGEITWAFSDKWEGTVGGRWFNFDYDSTIAGAGFLNGGEKFEQLSADETGFTPRLNLSYFHSRDVTLYGAIANGYRPGGANQDPFDDLPGCEEEMEQIGLARIPDSFESDSLWSYELGFKSNWAKQSVYVNAAVYYIDWTDMQTQKQLQCGINFMENVGKAVSKGIEIELAAYPARNLELTLNGNYSDAKLSEDVPNLGGASGDDLPGVPDYTFGGSITWFFKSFEGVTSSVRADYQYVGESYNDINPAIRQEIPSYSLTNLRLNFRRNRWETSLYVNNLFDNWAVVTVHNNLSGQYVTTAQPFTVGVSARFIY